MFIPATIARILCLHALLLQLNARPDDPARYVPHILSHGHRDMGAETGGPH